MIHIIITAGGTVEDIDGVRKIANTSTGTLGTLLCNETIQYMEVNGVNHYTIHYIVSETGKKPVIDLDHIEHVIIYEITNVNSVAKCIKKVMEENSIDYFIHSMAVSDFTTSYSLSVKEMAKQINNRLIDLPKEQWVDEIEELLISPRKSLEKEEKISSKSDLLLGLKRTQKIISTIKEVNKHIFLVGFKLLKNATEEELITAANILADKNACDLVFANDLQTIDKDNHRGLLIENNEVVERLDGKRNIAKAIVYRTFKKLQ